VKKQSVSVNVNMEGKNIVVAYLLWWFLGWAGVHRFYLGRVKTGFTQLLLTAIGYTTLIIFVGWFLIGIWFIWWVLDAFLTYQIVQEENEKLGVLNSTISVTKSGGFENNLEQLEKLHALYEKGVITQEEYEKKKAELL